MTRIELKMKGGNSSLRLSYSSTMYICDAVYAALRDAKRRYPGCKFKILRIQGEDAPMTERNVFEEINRFLELKKMKNANNSTNET